jgi:hypothetical protein
VYVCLSFYDLSSIIGCTGLVEIFWRAGSRTYLRVCVSAVWSAGPVRVYLVPLPVWVAVQYGYSVFLGSVLACFARLKWGGGGTVRVFLVSLVFLGGYGTIEMAGLCCNFLFIFFSFMLLLLASGYAR